MILTLINLKSSQVSSYICLKNVEYVNSSTPPLFYLSRQQPLFVVGILLMIYLLVLVTLNMAIANKLFMVEGAGCNNGVL